MLKSSLAVCLVIGGAFFWAVRDYLNKISTGSSTWKILGVQMMVGLVLNTMMYYASEVKASMQNRGKAKTVNSITWREHGFLAAKLVAAFTSIVCNIAALKNISLGISSMIHASAPIFIVLWSALLLGERIRPVAVACIAVSLAGLTLSVKPWTISGAGNAVGYIYAVISAIFTGLSYASFRGLRNLSAARILFVLLTFNLLLAFSIGLLTDRLNQPTAEQWFHLILTGVVTWAAEVCMTKGYALAVQGAGQVAVYKFLTPVFSIALDFMLLHHVPDWATVVGGAVVLIACVVLTCSTSRQQEEANGDEDRDEDWDEDESLGESSPGDFLEGSSSTEMGRARTAV